MLFCESKEMRYIERLMQSVPNMNAGGKSIVVQPALQYDEKLSLNAQYDDLVRITFSSIRLPPLRRRVEEYLSERKAQNMDYRNEKHRIAFRAAVEGLDQSNKALMAAIYLLSADYRLWKEAQKQLGHNNFMQEKVCAVGYSESAYTLLCAAKDLYLGTNYLTIGDLADQSIVSSKHFALICNAMVIRRFGLSHILRQESGTEGGKNE